MAKPKGNPAGELPSREQLLQYITEAGAPVKKRDIANHFALKGAQRETLKDMLADLEDAGEIERGEKRSYRPVGALPEVMVLEISGRDPDGELLAEPVNWDSDHAPPAIYVSPDRQGEPTIQPGVRVLARMKREEAGSYVATLIRVLAGAPKKVLGIYEKSGKQGRLRPTDKRVKQEYILRDADAGDAEPGEFLLCEVKPHHRRAPLREVRVAERLGDASSPKAISLIAIHENDIPADFPDQAIAEAESAAPVTAEGREDLRDIPLVTIDGPDAKDFDDAVRAVPDDDPANPGGYRIMVAIADVAHYVRPGSQLDRTAWHRGNSVYFPDRVVPMLPEGLSNGWCSLRPGEDRGCLATEICIDRTGKAMAHRFTRGLMRSAARLTYEQVQAAHDGTPDETTGPLLDDVIEPLYGALDALLRARADRGTLDIDVAEKQVVVNDRGEVTAIEPRARLDSHRLIEEFMIAANVAAAETLEQREQPCMYRVHEPPDPDKIESLRQTLNTFDVDIAPDQAGHPSAFKRVLEQVQDRPEAPMINQLVLRCQSQAYYSPNNLGHFGLALDRYAHFTSPIRRYSDLLVHRALIDGLKLGDGGLAGHAGESFEETGEHISFTERRAQQAEFDAIDRFTAAYLRDRVGGEFQGRITGVTHFGLFVMLHETGADGLVPIATLPNDFYQHDPQRHCLVGKRWGRVYRLGDGVRVRLSEADATTGGLVLEVLEVTEPAGETHEPQVGERGGPHKGKQRKAARGTATARQAEQTKKRSHKKRSEKKVTTSKTGGSGKGKGTGKPPRKRKG